MLLNPNEPHARNKQKKTNQDGLGFSILWYVRHPTV